MSWIWILLAAFGLFDDKHHVNCAQDKVSFQRKSSIFPRCTATTSGYAFSWAINNCLQDTVFCVFAQTHYIEYYVTEYQSFSEVQPVWIEFSIFSTGYQSKRKDPSLFKLFTHCRGGEKGRIFYFPWGCQLDEKGKQPRLGFGSISSSSCRAGSKDIPDPLSPLLPIVHRPRQVFRTTSRILT